MNLNQFSITAAQPGLAIERILNLNLAVPPLPEQKAIAEYLDNATTNIDSAINRACQIELLNQYCTRWIAHVVTGKLDVRELRKNYLMRNKSVIFPSLRESLL